MLAQLLTRLSQEFEIEEPRFLDHQESYALKIGSSDFFCKELGTKIFLYGDVGILALKQSEDILMAVMRANFLGQGTGGGSIGLAADEKTLNFSFMVSSDIDFFSFKEGLESFINYFEYWKEQVLHMVEGKAE